MTNHEAGQIYLPKRDVQDILFNENHNVHADCIHYYPSLDSLAETARGSKNWSMNQTFVYAASPDEFVILCQVAPASCEMMVITQNGFHDVLTAYRYGQDELVEQLRDYLEGNSPSVRAG